MKKQAWWLPFCWLLATPVFAQNNCQGYYLSAPKGSVLVYEMTTKKGKPAGTRTLTVMDLKTSGGQTEGVLKQVIVDEKGKNPAESEVKYACNAEKITIDSRSLLTSVPEMAANMEMRAEGKSLETPINLSVGQTLPDAEVTIELYTKGNNPSRMGQIKIKMFNRKVVAKEKIATPAGEFDCFKITYDTEMENQMVVTMRFNLSGIEWVTLGKGLVRSESYRKGELVSAQVLKEDK
ncbi:MAG: hypothetical protein MUC97_15670 [Bernardetiaceae bacterium]|jgi:hypothetical protein|nr:hypothetical protein [Bernardetiaceae bacterium]